MYQAVIETSVIDFNCSDFPDIDTMANFCRIRRHEVDVHVHHPNQYLFLVIVRTLSNLSDDSFDVPSMDNEVLAKLLSRS